MKRIGIILLVFQQIFRASGRPAVMLLICFAAFLASTTGDIGVMAATQSPENSATAPKKPGDSVYKVLSPIGDTTVKMITMVPRLDTLADKTVCMMWNHAFQADITLPSIGESLKEKFPNIKIVPYSAMPDAHMAEYPGTPHPKSAALQAVFREKGCDAVISGNGG
jgi:hypothetical protein